MSKLNSSLKKEIEATFNPNNLELYAEWTWSVEDAFDRCPENPNRRLIRIEWQTIARDLMTDKYLSRPYGAGFNHSRLRFFTTIECDVVNDSIGLEQNLDITLDFSSLKSSRIQFCNGSLSKPPRFDRDVEVDLTNSLIKRFQEPKFKEDMSGKVIAAITELYNREIPF